VHNETVCLCVVVVLPSSLARCADWLQRRLSRVSSFAAGDGVLSWVRLTEVRELKPLVDPASHLMRPVHPSMEHFA
jgi:hypothetical protein